MNYALCFASTISVQISSIHLFIFFSNWSECIRSIHRSHLNQTIPFNCYLRCDLCHCVRVYLTSFALNYTHFIDSMWTATMDLNCIRTNITHDRCRCHRLRHSIIEQMLYASISLSFLLALGLQTFHLLMVSMALEVIKSNRNATHSFNRNWLHRSFHSGGKYHCINFRWQKMRLHLRHCVQLGTKKDFFGIKMVLFV